MKTPITTRLARALEPTREGIVFWATMAASVLVLFFGE